jgi:hypothetical protein
VLQSLAAHPGLLGALAIGSVALFLAFLVFTPWAIARIPHDYFAGERSGQTFVERHPLIRFAFHVVKNLCGLLLLAAGFIMLFIPGQGLLTMLLGIVCMDFPGKRKLEQQIVARPAVLRTLNWIRAKQGQRPLIVD